LFTEIYLGFELALTGLTEIVFNYYILNTKNVPICVSKCISMRLCLLEAIFLLIFPLFHYMIHSLLGAFSQDNYIVVLSFVKVQYTLQLTD